MEPTEVDFDTFYRHAYPRTVAMLRSMGYGPEESADSVAEAMIELYTSKTPVHSPAAWVMRVALRDAARNAKKHKRDTEQAIAHARREPVAVQQPPGEPLDRVLLNLLEQLKPSRRKLIVLAANGFNTVEIAEILEARAATVRSNLRHARDQLSRLLGEACAGFTGELDEHLIMLLGEGGART